LLKVLLVPKIDLQPLAELRVYRVQLENMVRAKTRAHLTHARRLAVDVFLSVAAFSTVTILPVLVMENAGTQFNPSQLFTGVLIYAAISGAAFICFRTYRMLWRFLGFKDILALVKAVTLTVPAFYIVEIVLADRVPPLPVPLMIAAFATLWTANLAFVIGPRFAARAWKEPAISRRQIHIKGSAVPALITGDTDRVEAFIRASGRGGTARHRIVGILSDSTELHGSDLQGVEVLGNVDNLEDILGGLAKQDVRPHILILAQDGATHSQIERILEVTSQTALSVGRLAPLDTFHDSTLVRPIELADLLGRPQVVADLTAVATMVKGKTVLVTGAGGSIGGELCRQIASLAPAKLVLADFGEYNLYSIDKELEELRPNLARETALLDVRDGELVARWIEAKKPDVVFHAAALKHVPLLESHPIEGIKTNVFGTVNVSEACVKSGVAAMVTISTDKAVNPCNVMGATKRLAEAYCQGLDQASRTVGSTRFITVRFGNVLGSAGSVVPLFQRQIENGGPVTITHPDISRFFMTIPEAVTLVLQAGAQGIRHQEERGNIYVLEMGRPVKIIDLARQMIRLTGRRPDADIKIEVVGLRPGEKLYEEVMHSEESIIPTESKSILKLRPRATDLRIVRQQVGELRQAVANNDLSRAMRLLQLSVPEYTSGSDAVAVRY
jgi:FlaA1/EpsC-like NDP-sugar epimerase